MHRPGFLLHRHRHPHPPVVFEPNKYRSMANVAFVARRLDELHPEGWLSTDLLPYLAERGSVAEQIMAPGVYNTAPGRRYHVPPRPRRHRRPHLTTHGWRYWMHWLTTPG